MMDVIPRKKVVAMLLVLRVRAPDMAGPPIMAASLPIMALETRLGPSFARLVGHPEEGDTLAPWLRLGPVSCSPWNQQ